jgi:hypothetical protein
MAAKWVNCKSLKKNGKAMKNYAWVQWIVEQFRTFGPYFAVELILPGGSIVALLLWLYRNRSSVRHHFGN